MIVQCMSNRVSHSHWDAVYKVTSVALMAMTASKAHTRTGTESHHVCAWILYWWVSGRHAIAPAIAVNVVEWGHREWGREEGLGWGCNVHNARHQLHGEHKGQQRKAGNRLARHKAQRRCGVQEF
jgi:hypothetical protein